MAWSKESRQSRGYGAKWDQLRLVILKRDNYLCQCSECKGGAPGGRVTVADQVNHKTSKAEAKRLRWTQEQIDDPGNLEAVNHDCHDRLTQVQKGIKPKRRIGADGWPIEG